MLDTRTVLILMSVASLLMAAALWLACADRFRDGLAKWTAALLIQALAWALYACDGAAPPWAATALPDLLLMASWLLKLAALHEYRHVPPPAHLPGLAVAACAALFAAALAGAGGTPAAAFRAGLFSAATAAIALAVWRVPDLPRSRIQRLMAGLYAVLAGGFLLRLFAVVAVPQALPDPLASTAFQTLTLVPGFAIILLSTFCMLLMHKERADRQNLLLARTDPLTGAYNRRSFGEHADRVLAHDARARMPTSLLMLDIDHFKRINDRHGHLCGDEVLKAMVARVRTCMRHEEMLMRYGGEEFCVLAPATGSAGAQALAERIRLHIAGAPLPARDTPIEVTVSIGVATIEPGLEEARDRLFAQADAALYAAKNAGRNRVVAGTVVRERTG